ncbi:MAG: cytochrome c family protein [Proteobacteria bacterium]|nr:cytochrome c family protein [Pseudomonadota bacterium]
MIDSWTFNKIAGAVLGTALLTLGLGQLGAAIYHPNEPSEEHPGFKVDVAEAGEAAGGGTDAPALSLGALLAAADPKKGATEAKACIACHDFSKGGVVKTGPDLWDIVDRPKAHFAGFEYSAGLQAMSSENWTYENLNTFLTNPAAYVKGTKMGFGGIKNDAKRANLLAYLATLSDAPKPFPAP